MDSPILGLHHVTATVADAQTDLDFCLEALGLRLVKKTVNFDNHHVYHFYYGTEHGTPGTIWTTFPYWGHGVPVGTKGAGQVTTTSFSVPAGSLDFWRARFRALNLAAEDAPPRFGEDVAHRGRSVGPATSNSWPPTATRARRGPRRGLAPTRPFADSTA